MAPLFTGSAREAITPPLGIPLGGNARSCNYATHVIHELYVRALYVEHQGTGICIVSLDILGLQEQDARALRQRLAEAIALPTDHIMITCTHTHSGPDTLRILSPTDARASHDREQLLPWMELLFEQAVSATQRAMAAAVPSRMCLQKLDNESLPKNRRLRLRSGETVMNWTLPDPKSVAEVLGPVDPQVSLATFYKETGELTGALVHFTLHPAILAGLNLGISGDYCGVAMASLESDFPDENSASFLFLNGALGNINHIDYSTPERGRNVDEVQRCATSLAGSVRQMLRDQECLNPSRNDKANMEIGATFLEILFPVRAISEEEILNASQVLSAHRDGEVAAADGVPPEVEALRTLRLHEVLTTGTCSGEFTTVRDGQIVVPLQSIRIGELTLSAVPAEMFVEHGLQLKETTGNPFALIVGPANGYIGYVPTPEAFEQGGYEPALGPGYLEPDAGEKILTALTKMQSSRERKHDETTTSN